MRRGESRGRESDHSGAMERGVDDQAGARRRGEWRHDAHVQVAGESLGLTSPPRECPSRPPPPPPRSRSGAPLSNRTLLADTYDLCCMVDHGVDPLMPHRRTPPRSSRTPNTPRSASGATDRCSRLRCTTSQGANTTPRRTTRCWSLCRSSTRRPSRASRRSPKSPDWTVC